MRSRSTGSIAIEELLSIAVKINRIDMLAMLLDLGLDPNEPVEEADAWCVTLTRGWLR